MKRGLFALMMICAVHALGQQQETVQLPGGVAYKMLLDVPGEPKPRYGDYVEAHMYVDVEGKRIYNSREAGEGKPIGFLMQQPTTKTDIQEVVQLMTPGDSVAIIMSVDSMLKAGGSPESWMKPNTGQTATYVVKLLRVKPMARKSEMPKPGKE